MHTSFFIIGTLFVMFSGVALIPLLGDLFFFQEYVGQAFLVFIAFNLFIGTALMLATRSSIRSSFEAWNTFVLTIVLWLIIPFVTAIPLYVWNPRIGFMNACFESVCALTTTGSTLLAIQLPKALFLWICLLQWFGGIGILVMGMTLFPVLRVGGMQLLHREFTDPGEKFLPRASGIASFIIRVYSLLTILCGGLCFFAGMPLYISICHALSTLSTGGLTPYAALNNIPLKIITMFFMVIGASPLILFVRVWHRDWKSFKKNAQLSGYISVLFIAMGILLLWSFYYGKASQSLDIFFNVISLSTTTGYFEWEDCASFPAAVLAVLGVIGGCMGSTAGGIKIFRLQILFSITRIHLRQLTHSHTVFVPTYQGQKIQPDVSLAVLSFATLYGVSVAFIAATLSILGHDMLTSWSCALSALTNSGTGLARVLGWKGSYDDFKIGGKICLMISMIMGRLELITPFLLCMPSFWKK